MSFVSRRSRRPIRHRIWIVLVSLMLVPCLAAGIESGIPGGEPGIDSPVHWITVSAIIFFAAIASSIVGFAFSAIAGAMILHYITDAVKAVQIMMIASIGIQAYSVVELARSVRFRRCVPFVAGGLVTLPLGIMLLLSLSTRIYVLMTGGVLVLYGLYMLLKLPVAVKVGRRPLADMFVGALGGITGPLAALPGFCVVIWSGMRGWSKPEQRAVYQPYILIMQLAGIVALWAVGSRDQLDPSILAYALPGLAGAIIGLRIFHALSDRQFQRMITLALIASGGALLLK